MTVKETLAILDPEWNGNWEEIEKHWDDSMATLPEGTPPFLAPEQWQENARWCGFDRKIDEALGRTAAAIAADPALRRLAWHAYRRLYDTTEPPSEAWPELRPCLGDDAPLFYLLLAIAFVPLVRAHHRRFGIPESVTRETVQQPRHFCDDNYRRAHGGRPGIFLNQLGWLRHYTREPYVRLGRLEFWLGDNPHPVPVYRHRKTGTVVALAPAGTRFAPDGSIYRNPEDGGGADFWDAVWEETDDRVTGTVLSPYGRGTRQTATLRLRDWECVLRKGDTVLMLHIPAGGRMSPEACAESFRRAAAFFPRHFPDRPAKAVVCGSWIFSDLLQEILPPEANLVQFQRELYLLPTPSSPWDGLWFVFLQKGAIDPEKAPRETSVQRAILRFLESGRRWHAGAMFFLLDDIDRFGKQAYISDWPPAVLEVEDAGELPTDRPRR